MWQGFGLASYLFFAKLPEISSSILIYLAPILYNKLEQQNDSFSLLRLFSSRLFLIINLLIILLFLFAFQFFYNGNKAKGILYLLPFLIQGLMILPINLITFLRFRSTRIREHKLQTALAIFPGLVVAALAIKIGSPLLLSLSVPVQLAVFLFIYQFTYAKNEVQG
jgi:hypothetical protein